MHTVHCTILFFFQLLNYLKSFLGSNCRLFPRPHSKNNIKKFSVFLRKKNRQFLKNKLSQQSCWTDLKKFVFTLNLIQPSKTSVKNNNIYFRILSITNYSHDFHCCLPGTNIFNSLGEWSLIDETELKGVTSNKSINQNIMLFKISNRPKKTNKHAYHNKVQSLWMILNESFY